MIEQQGCLHLSAVAEVGVARSRSDQNQNPTTHAIAMAQPEQWWVWEDSNLRPYAYQAYALTT